MLATGLLAAMALSSPVQPAAAAAPCDARERAAVLAPALGPDDAVRLTCSLRLGPGDVVTRRLVLEGSAASGIDLDCGGGRIGQGARAAFPNATLEIRSALREENGTRSWERPSGIRIHDCRIVGSVRIWGMAVNGQGEALRLSSYALGHTERAQAAAPTRVTLDGVTIEGTGTIPLYIAPGVTAVTLSRSRITGRSDAVGLYLDAESARNTVIDTEFDVEAHREMIAVDGSAHNRITGNRFRLGWWGGIFLYRNCGEGGTVRHQTPSFNTISGNRFAFGSFVHLPSVWVGSRYGFGWWCHQDDGFPFGSSADDGDNATDNLVTDNAAE